MSDSIEQPGAVHYRPPGPVAKAFVRSDAFVCAIRGPIGSGKSTACIMKLIKNCKLQQRHPDGWIRRRTAIVRNTYPELKTTTIKSWHQWIPPHVGQYRDSGPPTHRIVDEGNKMDWEVIFIALDRPDDVRKLLSFELSDAWINEAREVPKAILDGLTGRVGRFPRTERDADGRVTFGCADPQILMDTNPPDTDHWWYKQAEEPTPEMVEQTAELEAKLREMGALRPKQPLFAWFAQPGGERPDAENMHNLTPGYYLKAKAGKTEDWIRVYVRGEYGYVQDGKPVYPEYRDSVHCAPFELSPRLPLHVGLDFGLTPAALIGQQTPNGQWRMRTELVGTDIGVLQFGEQLKRHLAQRYPGFHVQAVTGDPAGSQRQGDERTCFDLLRASGVEARPAHANDWDLRREAFAAPMRRMIDGSPGILIHSDCKVLRKGLAGAYCYKRIQVAGDAKFRDKPDKNMFSHVCEAGQYLMLGAGEGKALTRPQIPAERLRDRPRFALTDYSIFGD